MSSITSGVDIASVKIHKNVPSYTSYKDYIEKSVQQWPEYRWLQIFFNHRARSAEAIRIGTRTVVFDSINGQLLKTAFFINDPGRFRKFLDSRPHTVRTRVIVLGYNETWSVDTTFIDIIASYLNLDPLSLQSHLKHDAWRGESIPTHLRSMLEKLIAEAVIRDSRTVSCLPSEEQAHADEALHFDQAWEGFSTMMCVKHPENNNSTVLFLTRNYESDLSLVTADRLAYNNDTLRPSYDENVSMYNKIVTSIQGMSNIDAGECVEHPILFSYHVLRPWLVDRFNQSYLSCSGDHLDYSDTETTEIELSNLQYLRESLHSPLSLSNGWHFARPGFNTQSQDLTISTRMQGLIKDIDILKQKVDWAIVAREQVLSRVVADAQLEEARQSRSTAASVASLTKVATIYIPLSFTASFYGMNMVEFGNGTGSLWIFLVSAMFCGLITAVPFRAQIVSAFIGFPTVKENPWGIAFRMARYFPVQGFWLALFCLVHSARTMDIVCKGGLYSSKRNLDTGRQSWYLKDKNSNWFWRARLKSIYKVTNHPDWEKRTFLRRVWMKFFVSGKGSNNSYDSSTIAMS